MNDAEQFIELYNQISDHLRGITGLDNTATFADLVRAAALSNAAVRAEERRLRDYGDLRNAIIHYRRYPAEIIAYPTEQTVSTFAGIVRKITNPRRLDSLRQGSIRCFGREEQLVAALRYMRDRDYSQVVVKEGADDELKLLTVEGVARWFELQVEEEYIEVMEAKVGDALACETSSSFAVMGRDQTIFDAEARFATAIEKKQPRLFAIIITHSGKRTQAPVGILTPWDLIDAGTS